MKRLSRANNPMQLCIYEAPLTKQETEMHETCFALGMKLANIANRYYKAKICNSKDLQLLFKDLLFFQKAFDTIAKI